MHAVCTRAFAWHALALVRTSFRGHNVYVWVFTDFYSGKDTQINQHYQDNCDYCSNAMCWLGQRPCLREHEIPIWVTSIKALSLHAHFDAKMMRSMRHFCISTPVKGYREIENASGSFPKLHCVQLSCTKQYCFCEKQCGYWRFELLIFLCECSLSTNSGNRLCSKM